MSILEKRKKAQEEQADQERLNKMNEQASEDAGFHDNNFWVKPAMYNIEDLLDENGEIKDM